MSLADLHIHSNYSDGSDSVFELVEKISTSGIKIFALTDHDTIEGCREIKGYLSNDITFIPSVELTCIADNIKCHILGYNCNPDNQILLQLIEKGKKLRRNKLETRINYLKETWNIELTQSELDWLYSRKSVVKTHIANVLVNRGLASNNLEAMKKYLDGCKAGDTRFEIEEAIEAITVSGGIPIWAHPLGGEGEKHDTQKEFLPKFEKMKSFGIQGLECYYSRYNIEEIDFLIALANQNKILITGGSDYHGKNKDIPLGKLNTLNIPVDSNELTILQQLHPQLCLK